VFRGTAVYFAANIATALISVLATAAFTRLLRPEDYGTVNLFVAGTAICYVFTSLGGYLRIAVLLPVASATQYRDFFSAAVVGSALLSVIIGATLSLVSHFSLQIGGVVLPPSWIWLLPLSGWLQSVTILRQYTLQARGEAIRYVFYQLGTPVLGIALSFACLALGVSDGWEWRVGGLVIAQSITAVYALRKCVGENHLRRTNFTALHRYVQSTWSLAVFEVVALFSSYLGLFVVTHYGGTAPAGIYSVALLFGLAVESAASAANRSFSAELSRSLQGETVDVLRWLVKGIVASAGVAIFALGVGLISPWLLPLLADKDYAAATVFIPWVCLRFVLLSLQRSVNSIALALGRAWQLSAGALASLGVSLIAAYALGPLYGGIGGVMAMLVGAVAGLLLSLILLARAETHSQLKQVDSFS